MVISCIVGAIIPPLGALMILFFISRWYFAFRSRLITDKGLDLFFNPGTEWTTLARVNESGDPIDLDEYGDPVDIADLPITSASARR